MRLVFRGGKCSEVGWGRQKHPLQPHAGVLILLEKGYFPRPGEHLVFIWKGGSAGGLCCPHADINGRFPWFLPICIGCSLGTRAGGGKSKKKGKKNPKGDVVIEGVWCGGDPGGLTLSVTDPASQDMGRAGELGRAPHLAPDPDAAHHLLLPSVNPAAMGDVSWD